MPAIKISLNRLINLFGESVNKLPEGPVRALAAQLMTLTAHSIRIDQKIDAQVKELGAQISTLTDLVQELAQRQGVGAPAPTAPSVVPSTPGSAPQGAASTAPVVDQEEPTPDDEFEARFRAEAEAEIAAVNGASEVVGVQ